MNQLTGGARSLISKTAPPTNQRVKLDKVERLSLP